MERNANFGLIGLATVSLFLGLLVFIVWLAGAQFSKTYTLYDIAFVGPVQDFSEGAAVKFNGIKVGEVTRIALEKANPKMVIARVRLDADVPIRQDSIASLEPQGLTGVSHVEITAGTATRPLRKDITPEGQVPRIASRSSAISDLLNGSGTVLSAAVDSLNRINRLLSDRNIATIETTFNNIRDVSDQAAHQKVLLSDADATLKAVTAAAQSLQGMTDRGKVLLDGDAKRAVRKAADAAEQIAAVATETRAMEAGLRAPAQDFATRGLPKLTAAILSLQEAAQSLKRLTDEAQQSPRALVTKVPPKELELKP